MKRFFTTTLLVVSLCVCVSADAYRDALLTYLQYGNEMSNEQYENNVKPTLDPLFPDSADKTNAIIKEYMSSQMMADMVDIYEPAFRKHVSEEDLKELIKINSDPRFAEINKRASEAAVAFNSSEDFAALMQQIQYAAQAAVQGRKLPEDIPVPTDISEEYQKAFMQYYTDSKVDETIMTMFQSLGDMLSMQLLKEDADESKKRVKGLMEYIGRNMSTIMMSIYYKAEISAADLQTLSEAAVKPACGRAMDAVKETIGNPIQLSIDMFGKLTKWMESHHPEYAAQLQGIVDIMKKMQQ